MNESPTRGGILWEPPPDALTTTRLGSFMAWLRSEGHDFAGYDDLWEWSVTDLEGFWSAIRRHFDLGTAPGPVTLASAAMPGAVWFPGSTWNYAGQALAAERDGPAVMARSEARAPMELSTPELRDQVARCRAGLIGLGVTRGDRVAGYLPNIPEAVVAFLATASLGAVWTSAPPEFGVRAVRDRFAQVSPVVLIAVDGYRYGGRAIDRRDHLAQLRAGLPSVRHTVVIPYLDPDGRIEATLGWADLLAASVKDPVEHAPVPFDHPLYVLYSSGTTGLPKAIVHGHGGIICEHVKMLALHHDLGAGDRFFWFSTTGWMMWNYLVSGLLVGAGVVCFDGHPASPDLLTLWRLAAETEVSLFGVSAPFIDACRKEGLRPADTLDLRALRAVGSTGAPLSPAGSRWAAEAAGSGVQVSSISGGTDVCTAFVGSSPLSTVRAGEISCRALGAKVEAWDDTGTAVLDRRGELVVAAPMPSMPVGLWDDDDGERLRHAYYERHPGVWTHGDWITIHDDGSCVITGRADATLNRGGVRLGTAEIYAVVDDLDEVADSLIVHLEADSGPGELVLFVVVVPPAGLDDALHARIVASLRDALSPRHAPDRIVAVDTIPRTLSGKRLEVPVKQILQGARPADVASADSLADPAALDAFVNMVE